MALGSNKQNQRDAELSDASLSTEEAANKNGDEVTRANTPDGQEGLPVSQGTPASQENSGAESSSDELDVLRDLILGSYQSHIAELTSEMDLVQGKLEVLGERIDDDEALLQTISPIIANSIQTSIQESRPQMIAAISPIMADTIRANIRESKGEMVEALYPLMGQLVQRAVREAMKDLVRRIDAQIQKRFSFQGLMRQIRAQATGVSPAELAIRESLLFEATDVFLIHRHSGLLLIYVGNDIVELSPELLSDDRFSDEFPDQNSGRSPLDAQSHSDAKSHLDSQYEEDTAHFEDHYDRDLISGMLTAIRDFVQDAFGREEGEHLDQVAYGDKQILIETAEYAYLAIVVEGIPPYELRSFMRGLLMNIENEFIDILREYDGNAAPFESARGELMRLTAPSQGEGQQFNLSDIPMARIASEASVNKEQSPLGKVPLLGKQLV